MINYYEDVCKPPNVIDMAPVLLKEFLLECDVDTFLKYFWLDAEWYESFLISKLDDINVSIGEWNSNQSAMSFTRNARSSHPSKISFPGLPSHAEVKTNILPLLTVNHLV